MTTEQQTAVTLLPCPLCGGDVILDDVSTFLGNTYWKPACQDDTCILNDRRATQEQAIAAWNHRLASQADHGETYRHIKRGTNYTVVGIAELQMAQDILVDGSSVVVYRGDDGRLWVREEGEFHDGRFEKLATHTQPSQKGEGDE